jgi:hypothetical protein
MNRTELNCTPLTDAERVELLSFLDRHHPPIAAELHGMLADGLELPCYLRILFADMRRFQAGKEPRNVQFLPGDPAPAAKSG